MNRLPVLSSLSARMRRAFSDVLMPYLRARAVLLRRLFLESDTTTIRVMLAVASLGYAAGLLLPFNSPFSRAPFAAMRSVMGEVEWSALFILHAVAVFWRLLDPVPRIIWAFAVNAFGLVLWFLTVGLVTASVGEYSPGTSMELTVLLAAFVALCRTGLNDEKFTP